jgi:hypothetical protein
MKPDAARSRSTTPRRARIRTPLPALALLLAAPPLALAQQPPTAGLEIAVVDGATAEPLVGAQVRIPGTGTLRTDAEGRARFEGLAPAAVEVEVRALGYQTRALVMDLVPGRTFSLSIPIEAVAVILPEVRVEAEGGWSRRARRWWRSERRGQPVRRRRGRAGPAGAVGSSDRPGSGGVDRRARPALYCGFGVPPPDDPPPPPEFSAEKKSALPTAAAATSRPERSASNLRRSMPAIRSVGMDTVSPMAGRV